MQPLFQVITALVVTMLVLAAGVKQRATTYPYQSAVPNDGWFISEWAKQTALLPLILAAHGTGRVLWAASWYLEVSFSLVTLAGIPAFLIITNSRVRGFPRHAALVAVCLLAFTGCTHGILRGLEG